MTFQTPHSGGREREGCGFQGLSNKFIKEAAARQSAKKHVQKKEDQYVEQPFELHIPTKKPTYQHNHNSPLPPFPFPFPLSTLLLRLQHAPKTKWHKRDPIPHKMLTHRLHPMQPQTMQHG